MIAWIGETFAQENGCILSAGPPTDVADSLAFASPWLRSWFFRSFDAPTAAQTLGWPPILYIALNRLARDYNLAFGMKSVQQFAQRFANDLEAIRQTGFEIRINEESRRRRTHAIESVQSRDQNGTSKR